MTSTIIDMSTLPAPDVVEPLDYESIYQAALAEFRARMPDWSAELESDPVLKLIEVFAYRELLIRARVNEAAQSVMLAYATGADLDQIGALFNVARLAGEDDTRLRYRIQQGFSALGAAGPAQAYRAHAMGVSAGIIDVGVSSGAPGRVDVCVLGHEIVEAAQATEAEATVGAILFPDVPVQTGQAVIIARNNSALLNAVIAALSDENVRPLTDQVVVFGPQVKQAAIVARLNVYRGPDPGTVLAQAQAALTAYLQRIRFLGYDMTRAGIIGALAVPGVQNVLLDSPAADIECAFDQVAIASSVSVTVERIPQ
jgi:phage-related baseplate assembly protein